MIVDLNLIQSKMMKNYRQSKQVKKSKINATIIVFT